MTLLDVCTGSFKEPTSPHKRATEAYPFMCVSDSSYGILEYNVPAELLMSSQTEALCTVDAESNPNKISVQ